jgi:hypothetical protein
MKKDFDSKVRMLNNRISSVNGQLMDEMEVRRTWQERFLTENKSTAHLNAEIAELKGRLSDAQVHMHNKQVELDSTQAIN